MCVPVAPVGVDTRSSSPRRKGRQPMSIVTILIIVVIVLLVLGFVGRGRF
jgi:hypothetical protein